MGSCEVGHMGRFKPETTVPLAKEKGKKSRNDREVRSNCLECLPLLSTLNGIAFNPHNNPPREVF